MSDSKRDEDASPNLGSAPAESPPGKIEDGTEQISKQKRQHKRKQQPPALHPKPAGRPLQRLEAAVCEPPLDTRSIAASRDEHLARVAHARASTKQHCLVHHSQSAAADAAAVAAYEARVSSLQAAAAAQVGKGIGDVSLGLALSPAVAELHSSSTECAAAGAAEALAAATTIAAATALRSSNLRHSIQNSADTSESSACLGCRISSSPTAAALLARIGRLPYSSLAQFSSSPPGFRQAATLRWPPDSAVPETYPAETILHQPCDLDTVESQTYSSSSARISPHGHQQATDPASQPKAGPTNALKSASNDITAEAGVTVGGVAAETAATASSRHASTGNSLRQLSASTSRTASILTAGGIAGAISRTATAPVDRLKMLMQINDSGPRLTIRTAFRAMAAEGSLHAFFRGNGANVLKIAPETALKLTFNDKLKGLLVADLHNIRPHERMFVGALAGASAQAIIYPLELIRTRLAVSPVGHYHGIMHCLALVLQQEGRNRDACALPVGTADQATTATNDLRPRCRHGHRSRRVGSSHQGSRGSLSEQQASPPTRRGFRQGI